MGGRPGNTLSIISTSPLPPAPDIWGLETLRRGLEDATGTGQALLLSANEDEVDLYAGGSGVVENRDDFYTGGGGSDGDGDDFYTSGGGNDGDGDRGVPSDSNTTTLPTRGNLEQASSVGRARSTPRATTRSQSRTIRSQSPGAHPPALVTPLSPILLSILEEPGFGEAAIEPGPSLGQAPAQDPPGPLSSLQEEWLDGQSLIISDAEDESTDPAEDEASYSSKDE